MYAYKLFRSHRKTISLKITPQAEIIVRAPHRVSKVEIDRLVASKSSWIEKHLVTARQREKVRESFAVDYGDAVQLRGADIPITARPGSRIGYSEGSEDGEQTCFYMPPGLPPGEIKRCAAEIYKLAAKNHLPQRTHYFANIMGIKPVRVGITSAKTRWGSCSTEKRINYSWRLMMASDDIIDYVIVHELAHILEFNHPGQFWATVASVLPDYKQRRERLKELQRKLSCESW